MKLENVSLVAALLLSVNVYAVDNVEVGGAAKFFYSTYNDDVKNGTAPDIFDKDASYADAAVDLSVSAELTEGVSAGARFTATSSLGLENNLVSGVWSGAHAEVNATGATNTVKVEDASYFSEVWMAYTAGKTTAKAGRMILDTPLAFTETWSITDNTFEAAVLLNEDLPDTTLMAAWIGKSNGSADDENSAASAGGFVTSVGGEFNTFVKDGAYLAGVINNSWEPLTAKGYYYSLQGLSKAYWLQADLDMDGILFGAQYTDISHDENSAAAYLGKTPAEIKDDSAYALMLGYAVKDVVTIKAAYSVVDEDGTIGVGNTATGFAPKPTKASGVSGAQTQLYTEMWWWYGTVSAPDAETYTISAEGTVGDGYDLYLGYWHSEFDTDIGANELTDVDEVAFTVSKSYGPLDASVVIIHDMFDYKDGAADDDLESETNLQLYLTYNF